jgi:hypothetical protein
MTDEQTSPADRHKGGAPAMNGNRISHGRYSLRLGALPKGCGHIRRSIASLRRQLEQAIVATRGEIDLPSAALVQTACRHERHAQLAAKWLRDHAADLAPTDALAISRDIARASADRDKAILALGLKPAAKPNPWEVLRQTSLPPPPRTQEHGDDAGAVQNSDALNRSVERRAENRVQKQTNATQTGDSGTPGIREQNEQEAR